VVGVFQLDPLGWICWNKGVSLNDQRIAEHFEPVSKV
jgi:hypothetical protein